MAMVKLWNALSRRKVDDIEEGETRLARVLSLYDLIGLGVGSTLGLGVYILTGSVAHNIAGPAVILSVMIAAVASAFAGICYAELAARVPKAGSAYVYSYATVGEFIGYTIGWNLILEYVIGTASVARGMSSYFDSLCSHSMSKALREAMPIEVDFLAKYPDFLSFGVILILTAVLAYGVKESSTLNDVLSAINLLTIAIVIVAGIISANPDNWNVPEDKVPKGFGTGGFMPFGVPGVMAGAAKCFFGFVGFDGIATTGEEAINPKRDIPLAIGITLLIIFLAYFGLSIVLTMMVPYYDQDPTAPFPSAFEKTNNEVVKWIVTIGAVFALCAALLGAMFPLPRVVYAMGRDGVLFKKLSVVNERTRTPVWATITCGIFAAVMALIFDLQHLIDMMSIGTLLAYTIVAVCVLVLRYKDEDTGTKTVPVSTAIVMRQLVNANSYDEPNVLTSHVAEAGIFAYFTMCIVWCILDRLFVITSTTGWIIATVSGTILILLGIIVGLQPVSSIELTCKVPLVPFIPCLSVLINLYLMFQLDLYTWIRFVVWVTLGYITYFSYGIRNSKQGQRNSTKTDSPV